MFGNVTAPVGFSHGVTLHRHVRYKETWARTFCGPMFSSVKPYWHTMSTCVSSARVEPFRQSDAGTASGDSLPCRTHGVTGCRDPLGRGG